MSHILYNTRYTIYNIPGTNRYPGILIVTLYFVKVLAAPLASTAAVLPVQSCCKYLQSVRDGLQPSPTSSSWAVRASVP